MGCLLILLGLLVPRVTLVAIFLFTRWLEMAFPSLLWPLLGLVFLPYTTLAYTGAMLNAGGAITPGWLVILILALVVDLAHWGGGYGVRRRGVVIVEK